VDPVQLALIAVAIAAVVAIAWLLVRRGAGTRSTPAAIDELAADEVARRIGAATGAPALIPDRVADAVATPEPVPTQPAVADGRVHRAGQAHPLVSSRRRLMRDSAGILLAACLVVLAVSTLAPPTPTGTEDETDEPTEVALASLGPSGQAPGTDVPTTPVDPIPEQSEVPTGVPATPTVEPPTPEPTRAPGATPTPRPLPTPTPRPGTTPAPTPTAGPTPAPTVAPSPTPSPELTPTPSPELTPTPTDTPTPPPPDTPPPADP
jgi:hypothetical protein